MSKAGSSFRLRLRGLVVALACAAVVAVSFALTPRPSGCGTHEQLGLPACGFLTRTRWPCPTCGLTTSLAAMAQGSVVLAFVAHPFGIVLFAGLVILGVFAAAELVAGRDVVGRLRPGAWWLVAGLAGLMTGWGVKLLIGWATGRFPVR